MSTMTAAAPVPARTRHLSVVRSEQLALPLTWDISPGVPAVPGIPRHLRVVGDPGTYDTERHQLERLADRGAAMRRHPSSRSEHQWRTVRSVRLCPVADGIVETSAVLVGESRSRAIAIRFEAVAGRWLVTAAALV